MTTIFALEKQFDDANTNLQEVIGKYVLLCRDLQSRIDRIHRLIDDDESKNPGKQQPRKLIENIKEILKEEEQ